MNERRKDGLRKREKEKNIKRKREEEEAGKTIATPDIIRKDENLEWVISS
jgi:hypothetical protein